MKRPSKSAAIGRAAKTPRTLDQQVKAILSNMERRGTRANREGMARFGIVAEKVFGISVGDARLMARDVGRDHDLALALWDTGYHDARMMAVFVAEPARMTPAEMERWCRSFQNWADCDAACFHVFDRTPHAFAKIRQWAKRKKEFEKRAAFALLASVALHDKKRGDRDFLACLPLIEAAAADERNFVKKGVLWALRGIGGRNPALYQQALKLATRLAASPQASVRWIGKNTLRELSSPASRKRMEKQRAKA